MFSDGADQSQYEQRRLGGKRMQFGAYNYTNGLFELSIVPTFEDGTDPGARGAAIEYMMEVFASDHRFLIEGDDKEHVLSFSSAPVQRGGTTYRFYGTSYLSTKDVFNAWVEVLCPYRVAFRSKKIQSLRLSVAFYESGDYVSRRGRKTLYCLRGYHSD